MRFWWIYVYNFETIRVIYTKFNLIIGQISVNGNVQTLGPSATGRGGKTPQMLWFYLNA